MCCKLICSYVCNFKFWLSVPSSSFSSNKGTQSCHFRYDFTGLTITTHCKIIENNNKTLNCYNFFRMSDFTFSFTRFHVFCDETFFLTLPSFALLLYDRSVILVLTIADLLKCESKKWVYWSKKKLHKDKNFKKTF